MPDEVRAHLALQTVRARGEELRKEYGLDAKRFAKQIRRIFDRAITCAYWSPVRLVLFNGPHPAFTSASQAAKKVGVNKAQLGRWNRACGYSAGFSRFALLCAAANLEPGTIQFPEGSEAARRGYREAYDAIAQHYLRMTDHSPITDKEVLYMYHAVRDYGFFQARLREDDNALYAAYRRIYENAHFDLDAELEELDSAMAAETVQRVLMLLECPEFLYQEL